MTSTQTISAEFPFESKYADVFGSKIHYIEQGEGDPILFLHGFLTSNYLWRNIIPTVSQYGQCIAPDLIGMGKSGKPDIPYRVFDHIRYIEAFIETLGLKNITLVLHSLGSIVGFDFAMRHQNRIKKLAFIEPVLPLLTDPELLSLPEREIIFPLQNTEEGYRAVIEENYLLKTILPMLIMRKLTEKELTIYREPFLMPKDRIPLWRYLQDLPPHGPQDVKDLIARYSDGLQKSAIPKLFLYSMPGLCITMETVTWARQHLSNLTLEDLGEDLHCPQETNPAGVSEALVRWYLEGLSN